MCKLSKSIMVSTFVGQKRYSGQWAVNCEFVAVAANWKRRKSEPWKGCGLQCRLVYTSGCNCYSVLCVSFSLAIIMNQGNARATKSAGKGSLFRKKVYIIIT